MASLNHDNIVQIYSVEQHQSSLFIVMEYVSGTNLGDKIQPNTAFPLPQVIAITHQIAKALDHAHDHGMIHRDIRPANVLVRIDGHIKLTNFGIAAMLDEPHLTKADQLFEILLYASPEQHLGKAFDARSDLYSLGLIFYELLTGSHPRRHLSKDQIAAMLFQEATYTIPPFPSSVPADVQAIVTDLLRYRSADRIRSARQLMDQLEMLQAYGPPASRSALQPNATVDDRTICELPALSSGSNSSVQREAPRAWNSPVEFCIKLISLPFIVPLYYITSTDTSSQKSQDIGEPEAVLLGASAPERVLRGQAFTARFVAYVEPTEEKVGACSQV